MTFAQMIDRVLVLVGEDSTAPRDLTRAEVGRYINDAYRQIVRETCALENQFWFQVREGTATYTLPANMGEIQRVTHRDRRIFPASVFELDRLNDQWEDETGEVDAYTIFERGERVIRTYRNPDYEDAQVLSDGYGTVIGAKDGDDVIVTDWHFRFQSLDVALGVLTDYGEDSETVVFAAAGDGGGADEDYGLVVDVVDSALSSHFEIVGDYGVVINVEDPADADHHSVVFFGATEDSGAELGIVIGVHSDGMVYVFNSQEGVNYPVSPLEFGTVIWWRDDNEILEVWTDETPDYMVEDEDEPRLPAWTHLGMVYGACSKALTKASSMRDDFISSGYAAMYLAWQKFLKERAINSTKETSRGFGQAVNGARRARRGPRLPGEYPRV